ncbi:MAG: hypothetical protein ACRDWN_01030, partial [Acidimicrobiales bacterium]
GDPAVALSATVAGREVRWLVPSGQLPDERVVAVDAMLLGRTAGPAGSAPPYWSPGRLGNVATRAWRAATSNGLPHGVETADDAGAAPDEDPPFIAPVFPPAPAGARRGRVGTGQPGTLVPGDGPQGQGDGPQGQGDGPQAPEPPSPGPGTAAGSQPPPSPRTVLAAMWTLLVLLVALAVLLAVAGWDRSPRAAAPAPVRPSAARILAVQLNLTMADFPTGWTVDTSATGPLAGFLDAGVGSGGGPGIGAGLAGHVADTPAEQRRRARIARRFSGCLGIPARRDRILGTSGERPEARDGSPAFAAPATGPPMEAGSVTTVYRSAAAARAATAQVRRRRFPSCFGRAVAAQVQAAANADPGTSSYGEPVVRSLALPRSAGVGAAGLDLTFPVKVDGATTTVQLGFLFVGGARAASTVVTFGTSSGFPVALSSRLVQAIERAATPAGA